MKYDCIAMEDIRRFPLRVLSDCVGRAAGNPFRMTYAVNKVVSHDRENVRDYYKLANDLFHILPAIGFIYTDALDLNTILAHMDEHDNFIELCFLDAASVSPLNICLK